MSRIDQVYQSEIERLRNKLAENESKISMTCDLWTSRNRLSFLGVTAHWVNADFCANSVMLGFKSFQGRHFGHRIKEEMVSLLDKFEITEKVLGITCDNASNNAKFLDDFELFMSEKHPDAGFSANWNRVTLNLCRLNVQHMSLI